MRSFCKYSLHYRVCSVEHGWRTAFTVLLSFPQPIRKVVHIALLHASMSVVIVTTLKFTYVPCFWIMFVIIDLTADPKIPCEIIFNSLLPTGADVRQYKYHGLCCFSTMTRQSHRWCFAHLIKRQSTMPFFVIHLDNFNLEQFKHFSQHTAVKVNFF